MHPSRTYRQISNHSVIFTVPRNKCCPPEHKPWGGMDLNSYSEEKLTSIDLEVYVAPEVPLTDEQKIVQLKAACTQHIESTLGWDRYRKENTDAGIYPLKFKTALDDVRALCIAECNRCEDDLTAVPVWPVAPDAYSYEEVKAL